MSGQQSDALRVRLLAAAVEELLVLELPALLRGIGVRAIAKRAGSSPTSFFREFGDVETFASALLEWVYDPERMTQASFNDNVSQVRPSALPLDTGSAFHVAEFRRLRDDDEQLLRSTLWAFAGQEGVERYRHLLATLDQAFAPGMARLLADWGREPRPPLTPADVVALQTALLMGYVLRDRVEPERTDVGIFTRAASALTMMVLRVVGDTTDLDDRLTELNYYPLDARVRERRSSDPTGRRSVVLQVAAELFGARGYDEVTMAQVARTAGISESTLYAMFPGKQQLAASLFRAQAADRLADRPPAADLETHLARIVTLAARRREHAGRYLAELAVPQPRTEDDVLVESTAEILGIEASHPAAETAVALTVRTVLADPDVDPEAAAARLASAVRALL